MPRLGQNLHLSLGLQCRSLALVSWVSAMVLDSVLCVQTVNTSCLLFLKAAAVDISFDLFKTWDGATFVRHSCLQLLAEMPRSWPHPG